MNSLIEEIQLYSSNVNHVESLLKREPGIDVNVTDSTGRTPLFYCVDTFDKSRHNYILESDTTKWPRLVRIAEILIRHGANVNKRVSPGWTVLHEAARHGDLPIIQLLLRHKMDPTLDTSVGGELPAELAFSHNHTSCAILLDRHTMSLKRQCRSMLLKLGTGQRICHLPLPIHLKLFLNYQNPFKGFKWTLSPQRPFFDSEIANEKVALSEVIEFIHKYATNDFVERNADVLQNPQPKKTDLIQIMNQLYTDGAFQCVDHKEPLPRSPRYSMEELPQT